MHMTIRYPDRFHDQNIRLVDISLRPRTEYVLAIFKLPKTADTSRCSAIPAMRVISWLLACPNYYPHRPAPQRHITEEKSMHHSPPKPISADAANPEADYGRT